MDLFSMCYRADELKEHPFFSGTEWKQVELQKV